MNETLLKLTAIIFISIVLKIEPAQSQQDVPPKLVCYYTNWAKDRPDPWAYVSSLSSIN